MSGMPEASCARPVCADHADPGIDPGTRAVVPGVTDAIKIDVWSDIACPWCYIGKRNLEKGLAETASDADAPAVEVTYHSFELSPDTPVDFEGDELDFLAGHKGMPRERVSEMLENVTGVAANAGLEYRFDLLQQVDDPTRFVLYEEYVDDASVQAHKLTPHYLAWREAVADLMATPRVTYSFGDRL